MDFLKSYLAPQQGDTTKPSGAETIERLCDRAQSSTLLEDRRDAIRALRSLSKKYRLEVGTQAMTLLVNVLEMDRNDSEITGHALDTLFNVLCDDPQGEEEDDGLSIDFPPELGKQFTEMFVKNADHVHLLLSLMEEYDFHVRWPTVKVITVLLKNLNKEMQEIILSNPMAISKLMDLLADSREIIRNDALLLLNGLTKGSANIQKIVAFENAFERLIDIVQEEGNCDGGVVVEDCLLLIVNLLKNNSSNQNFFKEGSYIQRLAPFFEIEEDQRQGGWSAQKVTNLHLMLMVVRTLVSPSNPAQATTSCQKVMKQCGLLEKLCSVLMASGVPADVLTEVICTVAELVRGNPSNQEYLAAVMAPSNPPRPAIVVLLMSMVNEKQPFVLRCAVLYCFQSFLFRNELGQSQIVQTLLPSSADASTISAGQLLCGGLFSQDPLSAWFASVALLHAIVDNTMQKEQLLRVQLATNIGNPPVSLLQQTTNILTQGPKTQTRLGLLMLLCQWCADCPMAVTHFLSNNANVPFLISQILSSEGDHETDLVVQGMCAFLLGLCVLFNNNEVNGCSKENLRTIIEKRIGLEMFNDKISQIPKHEAYAQALKRPYISAVYPSEVVFDFQFCRLFKAMENDVLKSVLPQQEGDIQQKNADEYKGIIRDQDTELRALRAELAQLRAQTHESDQRIEEMTQQVQELRDQNSLLKATRGAAGVSVPTAEPEVARLHDEIAAKKVEIDAQSDQIEKLRAELSHASICNNASTNPGDLERLRLEVKETNSKLEQREQEVQLYKGKYEDSSRQLVEMRQQSVAGGSEKEGEMALLLADRNSLAEKNSDLEKRMQTVLKEKEDLKSQVENARLDEITAQEKLQEANQQAEKITKEQEDLLVLLTDQDAKINTYKSRLIQLGETVEESDEDDDSELETE